MTKTLNDKKKALDTFGLMIFHGGKFFESSKRWVVVRQIDYGFVAAGPSEAGAIDAAYKKMVKIVDAYGCQ